MKKIYNGLLYVALFTCMSSCGMMCTMERDGEQTVVDQFKPSELLKKYEWFKDASASLDAKVANLGTYESRFKEMKTGYGKDSISRGKWARDDREQYSTWESEYTGVKASYNELAATYNAEMVKFNYKFCNVGDLPKGATVPLPKEYKPYINQ